MPSFFVNKCYIEEGLSRSVFSAWVLYKTSCLVCGYIFCLKNSKCNSLLNI